MQKSSSSKSLVAATKINIDGDCINFISNTHNSEALLSAHEAAVKAGKETRLGILELFKNTIL